MRQGVFPSLPACSERLRGWFRVTGGTPTTIRCTRLRGHDGNHCDQHDGNPIEWFGEIPLNYTDRDVVAPEGYEKEL